MKKSYTLSFLLVITVQSMVAENMKRSFQTVCTDIRAVMKGNASPEQKERLIKQGAAMVLAFSISLYCVSALGAMWDGQKVLPIQLGAFARPPGPKGRRKPSRSKNHLRRSKSGSKLHGPGRQDVPLIGSSDFMRGLFNLELPPAASVLRDDSASTPGREKASDSLFRKKDVSSLPGQNPGSPFS